MELAPRYCRTCSSRIIVKNICHNCNKEPLSGNNYCYDCGALTPHPEKCLICGAAYEKHFPLKLLLIIAGIPILAIAAFFIFRYSNNTLNIQENTGINKTSLPETNKQELPIKKQELPVNDSAIYTAMDTAQLKTKINVDSNITNLTPQDSIKKPEIITAEEIKPYKLKCSYFLKRQKSQILFFTGGGSGYLKINGKIYELRKKRKGVDIVVFAGDEYEATITIDGLSGSDKEWLAACTLKVKSVHEKLFLKTKIYSYCMAL